MNNHKIHIYYYAFYAVPPGPGQYDTTVPGYYIYIIINETIEY